MTALPHKLIEQRRQELGIGIAELARRIGVSVNEYRDVEAYNDELTMVLPLKHLRPLAAILDLDLGLLLGAPAGGQKPIDTPRHILLADARRSLGVSTTVMADDIGFEEVFVHSLEADDQALENYPFEVLKIVATYLKLDPADLLHIGH
jgi:ribosome-binding protein aMBF1 (putative translation factor)